MCFLVHLRSLLLLPCSINLGQCCASVKLQACFYLCNYHQRGKDIIGQNLSGTGLSPLHGITVLCLCPSWWQAARLSNAASVIPALLSCVVKIIRGLEHLYCEHRIREFCSDRTKGKDFKLKDSRFRLDIRKKYFLWRWWSTGTDCPEKLCLPHSWRCLKSGWPTGPISVAFWVRLHFGTGKKFFTSRTTHHSNNFPRDVVETSSLEIFKMLQSLLGFFSHEKLNKAIFWGPIQPELFYDLMIIYKYSVCTRLLAFVGVICHLGI